MFDLYAKAAVSHLHVSARSRDAAESVFRREDFSAAIAEITAWEAYRPTPLHSLRGLSQALGLAQVVYKDEGPRFGLGSFKALGGPYAAARVLQREVARISGGPVAMADIRYGRHARYASKVTLACATDGNHGRSVAWGAQRLGTRCRIYIHAGVSEGRARAMRAFGAELVRIEGDYDDAVRLVREDAEINGWHLVSDTSWQGYTQTPRDVMAGYGVMSHEINEELRQAPTHVVLQGGVGGLAASVCASMRQRWGDRAPRVIVVEPERAACLYASAGAGELRSVVIEEETIMAGLSCGEPSALAWSILRDEVTDYITIPDSLIAPGMRMLAHPTRGDPPIAAGESGIAGLVAAVVIASNPILRSTFGFDRGSRVLLIGSEGITDPEIYAQIMAG